MRLEIFSNLFSFHTYPRVSHISSLPQTIIHSKSVKRLQQFFELIQEQDDNTGYGNNELA